MYPRKRSLAKQFKGSPFTIIGVNTDRDREAIKQVVKKERLAWPSFWDGGSTEGPIATRWNVGKAFPVVFLIDANGVVRHPFVGSTEYPNLEKRIEPLVKEAEALAKGGNK